MSRESNQKVKMLLDLAKELENKGNRYSADEQANIRRAANAVVATVDRNLRIKLYSYNEDD